MTPPSRPPTLLMIAPWLPRLSETFVSGEILALRRQGVTVLAASVHQPEMTWRETELAALAAEAIPVYGPGWPRLLGDALGELFRHPESAADTLILALGDARRTPGLNGLQRMKVLWQALAGLALARRIRPARVEHLHAHMAHVPTTIAMYAARQLGIAFSFTGHAADITRDRALLAEKLERAAFVRCISFWHRRFYREIVARPDSDYPVVRCGVDTTRFAPDSGDRRTVARSVPLLILGVGRLVPKKGFDLLLKALAALSPSLPPWRCRLVGEGPELPNLIELARRFGLGGRVSFTGALANPEVAQELHRADLFILPCRTAADGDRDGIPVVLMEAMATGVCAISGDLPTIRELIHDRKHGRLVPPDDQAALARILAELLTDHRQRQELASQGRRWVEEEFSLELNTRRLLAALGTTGRTPLHPHAGCHYPPTGASP